MTVIKIIGEKDLEEEKSMVRLLAEVKNLGEILESDE